MVVAEEYDACLDQRWVEYVVRCTGLCFPLSAGGGQVSGRALPPKNASCKLPSNRRASDLLYYKENVASVG